MDEKRFIPTADGGFRRATEHEYIQHLMAGEKVFHMGGGKDGQPHYVVFEQEEPPVPLTRGSQPQITLGCVARISRYLRTLWGS